MNTIPITKVGAELLKAELHRLKHVERPAVINAISEARAQGDLSENAEYDAAKEKQGFIEGRIKELETTLSGAGDKSFTVSTAAVIREAPCERKTADTASSVAPVVRTSSTRITCAPATRAAHERCARHRSARNARSARALASTWVPANR